MSLSLPLADYRVCVQATRLQRFKRVPAGRSSWSEQNLRSEQRQLTELLWEFAVADQARRDYLHDTEVFDDDAFAMLRGRSEDARRDLRAWAGQGAPA